MHGAPSLILKLRLKVPPDPPNVKRMTGRRHAHIVQVLIALVAVLAPAAVLAVTTVGRGNDEHAQLPTTVTGGVG